MDILTLRKLRRLIQKTNLTHDTPYTETPMYAVEMLIYLALYQHDHPIYSDELQRAVGCKIDKVLCTARDHLRDYITYTLATRPNIRHPVKQFRLTPKGMYYINNLVKELEA